MVSLKKEPKLREITPVHLMDEEEAVRTFCPQKAETTSTVDILVKQQDKKELPAEIENCENKPAKKRTYGGFEKWEWVEMIVTSLFIIAVVATFILLGANFLAEWLQLIKDLEFGG